MKAPSLVSPRRLPLVKPQRFAVSLLLAGLIGLGLPTQGRGAVHGGIEIGAKGVKATVLDVRDGTDGYEAKILLQIPAPFAQPCWGGVAPSVGAGSPDPPWA